MNAFTEANTLPSLEQASGARLLGLDSGALIEAERAGFPYEAFEQLRSFLRLPARALGAALSIAERTLARRRKRGSLTPEESDRLARLARLSEMALVVFEGDEESARTWLTTPKRLLGGESPLERADTGAGAREVEDMLYAIEFTMAA